MAMEILPFTASRRSTSNICYVDMLPDELWLNIIAFIHPVYDNLLALSLVCKKWYHFVALNPDPCLWEQIRLSSVRRCCPDSPLLKRFKSILAKFGKFIKTLSIHRCHQCFSNCLQHLLPLLVSLQTLELTGMKWNKKILRSLICYKSLKHVVVEASEADSNFFTAEDLCFLSDKFPNLSAVGLHFSSLESQDVNNLTRMSSSRGRDKVNYLSLERGRLEEMVLNDIIQGFPHLESFRLGNDNIFSWPSLNSHALESQSITDVSIFSIGDVAEFSLHFPHLRRLRLSNSTSVQNLQVYSSSLRSLVLINCAELRKLRKVNAFSLQELEIKGCTALCQAELLYFLVKNPDIKTMALGVHWPHLRLDQHSNPSLESISISDNGEFLSTLDLHCLKLKTLQFKKAFLRPSKLKAVRISGVEYTQISFSDVPYLRRIILDASKVATFEVDFDRTANQIKPAAFTKIRFISEETQIHHLILRRCNIGSIALTNCSLKRVTFDRCNLDCALSEVLEKCGTVERITFTKCYGPCQLMLENPFVKDVSVKCCSALMMERITLVCTSLEMLEMKYSTFLPTADELEYISNSLRKCCPKLKSINFSCH